MLIYGALIIFKSEQLYLCVFHTISTVVVSMCVYYETTKHPNLHRTIILSWVPSQNHYCVVIFENPYQNYFSRNLSLMVRYLLGTKEQRDINLYPFVLYHWTGMCDTISCFVDEKEANNWIDDVRIFCLLVAEVNHYSETPRHRVEFIDRIVPAIFTFLQRWGGARVPQDIRLSIVDGFSFFGFGHPPKFPPDTIFLE